MIENTVSTDSGAELRDGIKTVAQQGVCPEALYRYVIANFADTPPAGDYTEALNSKALQYMSLSQDLDQMKGCLASGFPFVSGFSVYSCLNRQKLPVPVWCLCQRLVNQLSVVML